MILLDYSGIVLNNVFSYFGNNKESGESETKDENLLRHIILNAFLNVAIKFKKEYGKITIAVDSRNGYWRKQLFQNYKIRRKPHETTLFDFKWCRNFMDTMVSDLKENTHYFVIEEDYAEADDVIAVLTKTLVKKENILIVSQDSDFFQLQKYNPVSEFNVKQVKYDLTTFYSVDDAEEYLIDKVIRGDSSDSIPNILSDDNVFRNKQRQTIMSKKRYNQLRNFDDEILTEEVKEHWKRNNKLINFDAIPKKIQENIWKNFNLYTPQPKYKLITYLQKYNLSQLLKEVERF